VTDLSKESGHAQGERDFSDFSRLLAGKENRRHLPDPSDRQKWKETTIQAYLISFGKESHTGMRRDATDRMVQA
jgi:hypothetical protein